MPKYPLKPLMIALLLLHLLIPISSAGHSEWDTFQGDVTRKGWAECNWVEGDVLWISDAENGYIDSSPVHHGDNIFVVSSGERGSDASIHCLDANTGSFIWNTTIPGKGYQLSTPVIVDGRLYLGSTTGIFYCLITETGEIDWQRMIDPSLNGTTSSPAYGETSDTLFIGTGDGNLYALETGSGNTLWGFDTGSSIYFSSPSVFNDTVYIGNDDGILYAVKQGIEVWRYQAGERIRSSAAVDSGGNIYFSSEDGFLRCLDNDGNLEWEYEIGASTSSPAVSEELVVVGSNNGLYSFTRDGIELFSLKTSGPVDSSPSITDTQIFFTVNDQPGELICTDTGGDIQWRHSLEERILSSPSIHNNTICIPSDSGKIWCVYSTNPATLELTVDPLTDIVTGEGNITIRGSLLYNTGRPAGGSTISIYLGSLDPSKNESGSQGNGSGTTGNGDDKEWFIIAQGQVMTNGSYELSVENNFDAGVYEIQITGSDDNLVTETRFKLTILTTGSEENDDDFIPIWQINTVIPSLLISIILALFLKKKEGELS